MFQGGYSFVFIKSEQEYMNCVRVNRSENFLDLILQTIQYTYMHSHIHRFSICTVEYTRHDKKTCIVTLTANMYKLKY